MSKLSRRRFKKTLSENKTKILILLFFSIIFLLTGAYAILRVTMNIKGKSTIVAKEESCKLNITADVNVEYAWGGNESLKIVINNESDEDIRGFTYRLKGPSDLRVSGFFDTGEFDYAEVDSSGVITLNSLTYDDGSPYWNAVIPAHGSYTHYMQLMSVEIDAGRELYPEWITFNGCTIQGEAGSDIPDVPVDPDVELESLRIIPETLELEEGETKSLSVAKSPANAPADIVWTSSDENVAVVTEDGIVTAVGPGTASITVSSGDISASAQVVVNEKYVPDSSTLAAEFTCSNYWGSTCQFKINLTNNSNITLTNFSFDIDAPEGTTFTVWYCPGLTITGNTFSLNLDSYNQMNVGGEKSIEGQMVVPDGYNINDYLSPNIINKTFTVK